MKQATLCIVVKENPPAQILLGFKKRGFGKGKFNGFGGKVEKNESIEEAALRELREEAGIHATADSVKKVGELTFIFPFVPEEMAWNQIVHVFVVSNWQGEPMESEEMKPVWFDIENIPFDKMWQDDRHWLPLVLKNKKIEAEFVFGEDNESIEKASMREACAF